MSLWCNLCSSGLWGQCTMPTACFTCTNRLALSALCFTASTARATGCFLPTVKSLTFMMLVLSKSSTKRTSAYTIQKTTTTVWLRMQSSKRRVNFFFWRLLHCRQSGFCSYVANASRNMMSSSPHIADKVCTESQRTHTHNHAHTHMHMCTHTHTHARMHARRMCTHAHHKSKSRACWVIAMVYPFCGASMSSHPAIFFMRSSKNNVGRVLCFGGASSIMLV
jgi:hypothetical protein